MSTCHQHFQMWPPYYYIFSIFKHFSSHSSTSHPGCPSSHHPSGQNFSIQPAIHLSSDSAFHSCCIPAIQSINDQSFEPSTHPAVYTSIQHSTHLSQPSIVCQSIRQAIEMFSQSSIQPFFANIAIFPLIYSSDPHPSIKLCIHLAFHGSHQSSLQSFIIDLVIHTTSNLSI